MHDKMALLTSLEENVRQLRVMASELENELEDFRLSLRDDKFLARDKCENICMGIMELSSVQDKIVEIFAKREMGTLPQTITDLENAIQSSKE